MSATPNNYPALFATLTQTILALVISTGLTSLTAGQAGVIEAAVAAQSIGHRWIGIESEERFCEIAARRFSQGTLVA